MTTFLLRHLVDLMPRCPCHEAQSRSVLWALVLTVYCYFPPQGRRFLENNPFFGRVKKIEPRSTANKKTKTQRTKKKLWKSSLGVFTSCQPI